ncbi:MAG: hypothetical protein LBH06_10285 [Rikenellaceae bacterium]|jgi:hypothetical protein|nr:hypothetical protein [Rikenellaceae bacterium]
MKKVMLLLALAVAGLFCGCEEHDDSTSTGGGGFLQKDEIGVYNDNGSALFAFDKQAHELGLLPSARDTRIQDDARNVLLRCRLTANPVVGESFTVAVTSVASDVPSGNYYCKAQKMANSRLWLWCAEKKLGFIVYWE